MRALVLGAAAALTGCGSFTHFQTARSLDAGSMNFDIQGASIAENEGVHVASRFRVGLGRGFDAGIETDLISLAMMEGGDFSNEFGLILGDLKWQVIRESEFPDDGGAPFSAALGFGGGTGHLTDFYFAQATVSRQIEFVEPYLALRYQRIRVDLDPDDPEDLEDLQDSYLSAVFEEAQGTRIGLIHLFVGIRFNLSDSVYFAPEISWIFGDADGVGSIGLAIGFETP